MITLKELKLTNFLSHSDTKINFNSNQAILISGCSGAGKTGLVEGILWGLYGRGRVGNHFLIKNGKSSAKVEIVLTDNDKEYQIIREINSDGKHNLEVLERNNSSFVPVRRDGTRELQSYIEKEILHASYSLFVNSIVSPQNNSDSFVSQTATRRKEIILEIAGVEKYDRYYSKTKEELEIIKEKELEKKIKIDNLKEYIEENKKTPLLLPRLKEENIELNSRVTELEKKLSGIKKKQTEIEIANAKISEKNNQLEEVINSINTIKNKLVTFQPPISGIPTTTTLKRIEELKNNEIKANEWNVKMLEIEREKPIPVSFNNKELKDKITLLENEETENCPELNKPCPIIIKERNKRIEELKEKLIDNNVEENRYFEKFLKYEDKKKNLGKCPETNWEELMSLEEEVKKYKEMKEQVIANSDRKDELKVLKAKEKKIRKEIEKIEVPKNEDILFSDKIFCEQELDETRYAYNENTKLLSVAENINETIKVNKETIKKIQKEKKELDEKIESLELLKNAFGNNGIKAIVVDQIVPELEDRINETLGKLSGFKIILETKKNGVSEDTVIEGLHIIIANELGEELEFNSFSGGEQMRITTAISLGFASFCNFSLKIMDEVIVGLDSETVDNFIEILNNNILKEVNQVIVISHISEIKECFENKIEIVKINGNSKIYEN